MALYLSVLRQTYLFRGTQIYQHSTLDQVQAGHKKISGNDHAESENVENLFYFYFSKLALYRISQFVIHIKAMALMLDLE